MALEPVIGLVEPAGGTVIGLCSEAEAVAAMGIYLQGRGHARFLQGRQHQPAVFNRNRSIVLGVNQKGGRGLRRDLGFVGEACDQSGIGVGTEEVQLADLVGDAVLQADDGIDEHGEVGAAALPVDRVGRRAISGVEVGFECGGEMAAGRLWRG